MMWDKEDKHRNAVHLRWTLEVRYHFYVIRMFSASSISAFDIIMMILKWRKEKPLKGKPRGTVIMSSVCLTLKSRRETTETGIQSKRYTVVVERTFQMWYSFCHTIQGKDNRDKALQREKRASDSRFPRKDIKVSLRTTTTTETKWKKSSRDSVFSVESFESTVDFLVSEKWRHEWRHEVQCSSDRTEFYCSCWTRDVFVSF